MLAGWRYLPRGGAAPDGGGPLDALGLLLVSLGVLLLVYGCAAWGERGTLAAAGAAVPVGVGVLALAWFAVRSLRRAHPVLDLRLFGVPSYAAASVTTVFTSAAMFGAGLLFPLYFQLGRGEDALATGLLLISMSIGNVVALPLTGRLVDRFGGGPVCLCGRLLSVAATVPFALLDLHAGEVLVQALLVVRGFALAAAMMPPTASAYRAVGVAQLPDATTQVNIVARIGGALGGALFAVVLTGALPAGAGSAFHTAFWWLTGASVLGLLGALWLTLAERATAPRRLRHTVGRGANMVDRRTGGGSTDTRADIRSVALELFGERGYERASLRELAERLRITKAAVYHHFATKEDILASLADEFAGPLDELLAWGRSQPADPDTRRELLRRYAELLDGRHGRLVGFLDADRAGLRGMPAAAEVHRRLDELAGLLTSGGTSPFGHVDPAAALRARLSLAAVHTAATDPHSPTERRDAALTVAWELTAH